MITAICFLSISVLWVGIRISLAIDELRKVIELKR